MWSYFLLGLALFATLSECAGPYTVKGNIVYDANGNKHLFRGVDRCSLEWTPYGDHLSQNDFQLMRSWGSNIVRISLNQDYWISGARNYSSGYQSTVRQVVTWAKSAQLDVILDLHWSDKGDLSNDKPGQQRMADKNSLTFWTEVSSQYRNDPAVLFELYNEPHDVSWDVWLNGGDSGDGFQAVGMQQLYNAARTGNASNPIIIGGLNWGYDLSGVSSHRVQGYNIIYNTHPYNYGGKQPGDWDNAFGNLAQTDSIIATEFGDGDCSPAYYQQFLAYAEQRNLHWTAWAWYPGGCAFPALINDWNGSPTVSGQLVKAALQKNNKFTAM